MAKSRKFPPPPAAVLHLTMEDVRLVHAALAAQRDGLWVELATRQQTGVNSIDVRDKMRIGATLIDQLAVVGVGEDGLPLANSTRLDQPEPTA